MALNIDPSGVELPAFGYAERLNRELSVRVLVLDANQRAALAVVRSLGGAGLEVYAADHTPKSLGGVSRFASVSLGHPPIEENPDAFLRWLDETVVRFHIQAIVPVTEISTDLVVRHRSRWPSALIPFAPITLIDRLSDKVQLFELAQRVGVAVPRGQVVRSDADVATASKEIGFPCIIKPHRSRILVDGRWVSTSVRRADNAAELEALLASDPGLQERPLLFQEFVPGHGAGVFTLYRDGVPVTWFAHRRLREKPPAGGVSVLSESVQPPPTLVEAARRLLDSAGWEGVAMVEFRVAPDGTAYLMEINARFWGSLQLAIDAGVDFPALLLEPHLPAGMAAANQLQPGRRLRWVLGDLDRLWLVLKDRKRLGVKAVMRAVGAFLCPDFSRRTRWETLRWEDPRPGLAEAVRYLKLE